MTEITVRMRNAHAAVYGGPERRAQARLSDPFPARVQGVDADGRAFDLEVEIDNICASGLYVRIPRVVRVGARLSTTVRFTTVAGVPRAKCLAVHGTVRRADEQADGSFGLAVEFGHHLFL